LGGNFLLSEAQPFNASSTPTPKKLEMIASKLACLFYKTHKYFFAKKNYTG
jgi:hypothetical protein